MRLGLTLLLCAAAIARAQDVEVVAITNQSNAAISVPLAWECDATNIHHFLIFWGPDEHGLTNTVGVLSDQWTADIEVNSGQTNYFEMEVVGTNGLHSRRSNRVGCVVYGLLLRLYIRFK